MLINIDINSLTDNDDAVILDLCQDKVVYFGETIVEDNLLAARHYMNALIKSADGFDKSWSYTETSAEERLLFGWKTEHAPFKAIQEAAGLFNMPPKMIDEWFSVAAGTDLVGITVNKNLSSIRLYTHHWNSVSPGDVGAIIYRGYKLLPDKTLRIDDYQYLGDLRDAKNLEFALANTRYPSWVERIVADAPLDKPLMFSKTVNSGRQSWLATVRHAGLDAGEVVQGKANGEKLIHVASGIDATKGPFDTLYFNADITEASRFLGF